ncbi:MAG: tellurite resistance TerB family protein [Pseudomonadota bacterium]
MPKFSGHPTTGRVSVNLNNIVQGLSKSGAVSGFAGGLAGSALVGAMSGKKGRKMAKSALKVGALAAVGGLAYNAYQQYRQNNIPAAAGGQSAGTTARPAAPEISLERFDAVTDNKDSGGLLIVRAMIAAAASDGHLDAEEQQRVFGEVENLELSREEKAMLFDELRSPLSMSDIVAQVSEPEVAIEVYAASLLAIDESRSEAQAYLGSLALALELPRNLVDSIHHQAATSPDAD